MQSFDINILNCLSLIASLTAGAYTNDLSYYEFDMDNDFSFNQQAVTGTPYSTILTSTTLIWIIHRLLVVELLKLAGKNIIQKDFDGEIEFDFRNKVRYI